MSILPAHFTKNTPELLYPLPPPLTQTLHLSQNSQAATTTGATLWLGSQILTAYLYTLYPPSSSSTSSTSPTSPAPKKLALDLGAGIGLASLALGALGFNVIATDVAELTCSEGLLRRNIEDARNFTGGSGGVVCVKELDWFEPPEKGELFQGTGIQEKEFDVIMTADTIYMKELIRPLLDTIKRMAGEKTQVWVALEVRDQQVCGEAMSVAREMGFGVRRIQMVKIRKAMDLAGMRWEQEDWRGVEVWRLSMGKRKE
ncbi:putative methyltransferase-domain-containing protein [Pyronema omphalodes]|nr:putative methyltransferase-domain-containing protein [Pyronema omphalodes]